MSFQDVVLKIYQGLKCYQTWDSRAVTVNQSHIANPCSILENFFRRTRSQEQVSQEREEGKGVRKRTDMELNRLKTFKYGVDLDFFFFNHNLVMMCYHFRKVVKMNWASQRLHKFVLPIHQFTNWCKFYIRIQQAFPRQCWGN